MATLRQAAGLLIQPFNVEPINIYGNAAIASITANEDVVPFIKSAALKDMRLLIDRQYRKAKTGNTLYGQPKGVFRKVISASSAVLKHLADIAGVGEEEIELIEPKSSKLVYSLIEDEETMTRDIRIATLFSGERISLSSEDYIADNNTDRVLAHFEDSDDPHPDYITIDDGATWDEYYYTTYTWKEGGEGDPPSSAGYEVKSVSPYHHFLGNGGNIAFKYSLMKWRVKGEDRITRFSLFKEGDLVSGNTITFKYGEYYPFNFIKTNNVFWDEDTEQIKKTTERTFKQYYLGKINSIGDNIREGDEDGNIVESAIINGIPIYSNRDYDNKYIFYYFKELLNDTNLQIINVEDPDDHSQSNQITINNGNIDYSILFRKITNTIYDGDVPVPTKAKIEYKHRWVDSPKFPNVIYYDQFDPDQNLDFQVAENHIEGENRYWSHDTVIIEKWVNGSLSQDIQVFGIQSLHRISSPVTDRIFLNECLPNSGYQSEWDAYVDEQEKSNPDTDVKAPCILFIPLDHTIMKKIGSDLKKVLNQTEERNIATSSFMLLNYGVQVEYIHWSKILLENVAFIISSAMKIYSIASLGSNIQSAIAANALTNLIINIGVQMIIDGVSRAILIKVFGKELGLTIYATYKTLSSLNSSLSTGQGFTTADIMKISMATIKLIEIGVGYKLSLDIKDLNRDIESLKNEINEEKDNEFNKINSVSDKEIFVSPIETAEEFVNRTTNIAVASYNTKTDAIVTDQGERRFLSTEDISNYTLKEE